MAAKASLSLCHRLTSQRKQLKMLSYPAYISCILLHRSFN